MQVREKGNPLKITPGTSYSAERGDRYLREFMEFFTGHKFDPVADYQRYKQLKLKWFDLNRGGDDQPVTLSVFRSFCDRQGHLANPQSQKLGMQPPPLPTSQFDDLRARAGGGRRGP